MTIIIIIIIVLGRRHCRSAIVFKQSFAPQRCRCEFGHHSGIVFSVSDFQICPVSPNYPSKRKLSLCTLREFVYVLAFIQHDEYWRSFGRHTLPRYRLSVIVYSVPNLWTTKYRLTMQLWDRVMNVRPSTFLRRLYVYLWPTDLQPIGSVYCYASVTRFITFLL